MRAAYLERLSRLTVDFPCTLALVAAAVGVTAAVHLGIAGPSSVASLLATRDGMFAGELWRLVSGPLLHSTWGHLLRDGSTVLLLGVVYERSLRRAWPVALAVGLVVPTAVVLAGQPELGVYYGLSGTFNTLMAVAVVHELRRRPPWWIKAIVVAYAGKLLFEAVSGGLLWPMELGSGVQPVPWAHLVGAAAGLVIAFGMRGGPRPHRRIAASDGGSAAQSSRSPRTSLSTASKPSTSYGLAATPQNP